MQEKGWKFLIRVKDGTGGVANGLDLPNTTTFDLPITLNLTRKQSNEVKQMLKDRNHYKLVSHTSRFDFLPERSRKHDPTVFYPLSFRIVRFPKEVEQIRRNVYSILKEEGREQQTRKHEYER